MLRNIKKSDLKEILVWRNSREVRKVMFTDHQITENEHLEWWEKLQDETQKEVLMFSMNNVNLGVVNFFDIDQKKKTCHWGFYLSNSMSENINRLEVWQILEKEAIEYAFNDLKCQKLICESFAFNTSVIEMHKRLGFIESDTIIKLKDKKRLKVVVTELTADRYYDLAKEHNNEKPFVEKVNENGSQYSRLSTKVVFLSSSNTEFLSTEFIRISKQYSVN
ncbi:MAG: UDP-4-amino-4,6-dideoxy-N-acetyl-beta-L-altrosamine N-acetyltransferase, partial [Pseudomonadota bacterium]|nr:UDP-4-amino-4,6-dideoxy-N-acetyl-beta-L-altrosamine N-acetyltransferase [Pseudomonadota bacterium]